MPMMGKCGECGLGVVIFLSVCHSSCSAGDWAKSMVSSVGWMIRSCCISLLVSLSLDWLGHVHCC